MNRRVFVTLVAFAVVYFAGGAIAQAQSLSTDVAFAFSAGGKDMPAGKYTVEQSAAGPVALSGPNGVRVVMPVITSLARHPQDQDAGLVFDKKDGKSILSEVWFPNREGLLLSATAGPHEHAIVSTVAPKK
jgi:hypothetical protein